MAAEQTTNLATNLDLDALERGLDGAIHSKWNISVEIEPVKLKALITELRNTYGVMEEAMKLIDQGSPRTAAEVLFEHLMMAAQEERG